LNFESCFSLQHFLVSVYFYLLENDKKSFIKGRDIQNGLIALYNKVKNFDKHEAKLLLDEKLDMLLVDLKDKGIKKPKEHIKYLNLKEKQELKPKIQGVFSEESFYKK